MVNKNSIYSLNKNNQEAIVYPSASGKPVLITREDFPNEEEFLAFKKWSDEKFHEEEKLNHREANHMVSADAISEAALATPAVDILMEQQQERNENRKMASAMVVKLKDKLTETQFRRLWMYEAEGKTLAQIAEHDGVTIISVYESIESAKKKISKKFPKKP